MSGFVRTGRVVFAVLALMPAIAIAGDPPPQTEPGNGTPADASGNAHADTGSVGFGLSDQIVITSHADRSAQNIAILSAIAVVGAGLGGLGLYYHLDSRTASNAVSTADFTHEAWTPALQAEYDRANRSATRAAIAYSAGGAFLIGAVVGLIVTAPAEETTILHPKVGAMPARGGGSIAAAWSF